MDRMILLLLTLFLLISCSDDGKPPLYQGKNAIANLSTDNIGAFAVQHCAAGDNPMQAFEYLDAGAIGECADPGDVKLTETATSISMQFNNACTLIAQNEIFVNGSFTGSGTDTSANLSLNLTIKGQGVDTVISGAFSAGMKGASVEFKLNMTIADREQGTQVKFENLVFSTSVAMMDQILQNAMDGSLSNMAFTFDGGRLFYSDFGYVELSTQGGMQVYTGAGGARLRQELGGGWTFFTSGDDQTGQPVSPCD